MTNSATHEHIENMKYEELIYRAAGIRDAMDRASYELDRIVEAYVADVDAAAKESCTTDIGTAIETILDACLKLESLGDRKNN